MNPSIPSEGGVERRMILKGAAGLGLTVLGAALISPGGCAENHPKNQIPLVTTGTVNIGKPDEYLAGTVSNKYMSTYGIAISNDAGTITAIRPVCTHKGCIAPWAPGKNEFVCPCHGSLFDIEGQPIKGPAKKDMARIAVIQNADGTLSVNLDQLYALVPWTPKA